MSSDALDPGDGLHRLSLPDQIYARLREEIATGVLRPGPLRLKPLATRFGTSQIPIREALRRLEAERLVSFDDNRAIVVNAISATDVDEIFAIRMELECLALRLAAPRFVAEPERLGALEALLVQMDGEQNDPPAWRKSNERFHTAVYEAAQAPRLLSIISTQWAAVEPYLRLYVMNVPSLADAQAEHHDLLDLLRSGDVAGSERVLRQQLASTRDVVLALLR
jgi:DNA-binding GntR family transcriptional regulator